MNDSKPDTIREAQATSETDTINEALNSLLAKHDPTQESYQEFRTHQFNAGLAWVQFPPGHGGLGVHPQLQRIVNRRLAELGAPPTDISQFFSALAAPTVLAHGNEDQKHRFLLPMFTGEEKWCQLFSEPGAGSDFAGLATKAERDGDEWIINGQKVWNTIAHVADWGMLVTRSDPHLPKHKGMTYFALDMHSEGVEVRPLRQITGEAEFNEVYLTDVRVPDNDRIGERGEGWRVSLTTLMNERTVIGGATNASTPPRDSGPIATLLKVWHSMPKHERNNTQRDTLMQLWNRAEVLRLTNIRAAQNAKRGQPGPEGSVAKLAGAELNKDIYNASINFAGMAAQVNFDYTFHRPNTVGTPRDNKTLGYLFLRARANSIEGGTSEILRNIMGEQILGLPGEPRVDKEVAWADVPKN